MPPSNTAAYLTGSKVRPFEVKSAPYTPPAEHQIVIKNGTLAINPSDWLKQDMGEFIYGWVKYPFVLGTDVAGEVAAVGRAVTRFKIGDRVVGHAVGIDEKRNTSAEGGFQTYTVLLDYLTSPIPSSMSYETASVIPLGFSTAACDLFQKDHLALQYPTVPPPKPTGKTVIIWGGSTSVGCNAIQLAVAAGYDVLTTASPKNFAYVKKLGASQVFDYASKTVVKDIVHALKGKTVAGAYTIGAGAADACMDILPQCKGDKFISMATYPVLNPLPKNFFVIQMVWCFVSWNVANWFKSKTRGVRTRFIFATTHVYNGVGKAVYEDFLPGALANGSFVAAPEPMVVGKGLESIQAACDLQKKGVSAKKVVVSL